MTNNQTTAPECTDPRKVEHWCQPAGTSWHEDSTLLADVYQWKYLRAELDVMYTDPDSDRSNLFEKIGCVQDLQGRMAKHTPFSFMGAGHYLEIAAQAILKKQTDPDDDRGDLAFALALIVRVNEAIEQTDGKWINWKDYDTRTDPNVAKIGDAA